MEYYRIVYRTKMAFFVKLTCSVCMFMCACVCVCARQSTLPVVYTKEILTPVFILLLFYPPARI